MGPDRTCIAIRTRAAISAIFAKGAPLALKTRIAAFPTAFVRSALSATPEFISAGTIAATVRSECRTVFPTLHGFRSPVFLPGRRMIPACGRTMRFRRRQDRDARFFGSRLRVFLSFHTRLHLRASRLGKRGCRDDGFRYWRRNSLRRSGCWGCFNRSSLLECRNGRQGLLARRRFGRERILVLAFSNNDLNGSGFVIAARCGTGGSGCDGGRTFAARKA